MTRNTDENREEICKWQLSGECIRYGPKRIFNGRCCPPCVDERSRRWYIDHKEEKKRQSRERSRRRSEERERLRQEELAKLKAIYEPPSGRIEPKPKIKLIMKN